MLIKVLKVLLIIQQKNKKRRINPYNPLSYAVIAIAIFSAFFYFAIKGINKEKNNPFKWQ